jgi:hypothetical protein
MTTGDRVRRTRRTRGAAARPGVARPLTACVMMAALGLAGTSCALLGYWGAGADPGPGAAAPPGAKSMRPVSTGDDGEFAETPVGNDSDASARLVDLAVGTADGVETVTFTFADTEVLPKFRVGYIDALRAHPEDEPLPLSGNALLQVEFSLTNPNTKNRLAVRPDLAPGQPQVKEVLLARNLGGSLAFGVGLEHRAPFRATELSNPTRLVVEVRTR